ncbi:hypothetical protein CCACVL1_15171 [Corchorus capsularis]|uniref:Uncharacterized protein n=1 Tax=Corchorus capsularis TaxID=210143 RepID=A0A1R3I3L5_COCAP|nr:hypothetical protein CCACVL1_15171 [Corchorus capsularis]
MGYGSIINAMARHDVDQLCSY